MIVIVDYGLGNVSALLNVYKRLNIEASIAKTEKELTKAKKIILPGVGGFDKAMHLLKNSGMRNILDELVLEKKIPVLGICVGMQIISRSSDEGETNGLSWIDGEVKSLRDHSELEEFPLPHMGWNDIVERNDSDLFIGLRDKAQFYFLHSYHFVCDDRKEVIATSSYGIDICSAVQSKNIYGVQFHPEKSHHCGETLLKNFSNI